VKKQLESYRILSSNNFIIQLIDSYKWFFLTVLVVLLHLHYKIPVLHKLELQGDEVFSVYWSQQPISNLLKTLNNEANPPLYFLFLHFWIKWFGIGVASVKSMSFLFSLGTATGIILIGKEIKSFFTAIFVSIYFLYSNVQFDFSHEIRAFPLVLFLCCISFWLFFRFVKSPKNNWILVFLILVNTALPFSHYNAALIPVIQFVASFFYLKVDKLIVRKLFIGSIISFLLFIPQLYIFLHVIPGDGFWLKTAHWNDLKFVLISLVDNKTLTISFVLLFLILPIFTINKIRNKLFKEVFSKCVFFVFWLWFALSILLNYGLAQFIPSFQLRYVLFAGFGLFFSIGYVVDMLKIPFLIKWLGIYLLFYSYKMYFTPIVHYKEPWKETAQFVNENKGEKPAIFVCAGYKIVDFLYYYDKVGFQSYSDLNGYLTSKQLFPLIGEKILDHLFQNIKSDNLMLILSHDHIVDPESKVQAYFDSHFQFCCEIGDDVGPRIRKYKRLGNCFNLQLINTETEPSENSWYWIKNTFFEKTKNQQVIQYTMNADSCEKVELNFNNGGSFMKNISLKNLKMAQFSARFSARKENKSIICFSIEKDWTTLRREEFPIANYMDETKDESTIFVSSAIPDWIPKDAEMKVYVYSIDQSIENTIAIKDLQISFWVK